jgi:hypothetical protein
LNYICPVCGYDKLQYPPYDEKGNESFEICHCCGFEFGYDDEHSRFTFESYRIKWISEGASWFYIADLPEIFDLEKQLKNIEKIKPMYVSIYDRRKQQQLEQGE